MKKLLFTFSLLTFCLQLLAQTEEPIFKVDTIHSVRVRFSEYTFDPIEKSILLEECADRYLEVFPEKPVNDTVYTYKIEGSNTVDTMKLFKFELYYPNYHFYNAWLLSGHLWNLPGDVEVFDGKERIFTLKSSSDSSKYYYFRAVDSSGFPVSKFFNNTTLNAQLVKKEGGKEVPCTYLNFNWYVNNVSHGFNFNNVDLKNNDSVYFTVYGALPECIGDRCVDQKRSPVYIYSDVVSGNTQGKERSRCGVSESGWLTCSGEEFNMVITDLAGHTIDQKEGVTSFQTRDILSPGIVLLKCQNSFRYEVVKYVK